MASKLTIGQVDDKNRIGAMALLCFFCQRNQKITPLYAEASPHDHMVVADGITYGVCPNHENDYQALKRRLV